MSSDNARPPSPFAVNIATIVLWVVLLGTLPLGIALIYWGLDGLQRDQPYCYGTAMARGDICRIDEYRVHRTNDYEGQLDYEHHGAKVQIGFGGLLCGIGAILLVGVVVSRLKKWPKYDFGTLLVTPGQAAALLGVPSMELSESIQKVLLDDSASLTDKDCLAAFVPAQRVAYGKRLWIDARVQTLTENTDGIPGATAVQIIEAVIEFPSAAAAARAQRAVAPMWAAAEGRSVTYRHGERHSSWLFGPLSTIGQTLAIRRTQEDAGGWAIQRAVAACGTVVIDVQVSGSWDGTEQARQLLDAIAANVTAGQ